MGQGAPGIIKRGRRRVRARGASFNVPAADFYDAWEYPNLFAPLTGNLPNPPFTAVSFCMKFFAALASVLVLTISCENQAQRASSPSSGNTQQVFQVKGVVKSVSPQTKSVEIRHEEITNFMPAMTMPFDVRNTNELAGLKPGRAVSFRLTVTDRDSWIDQIQALPDKAAEAFKPAVTPTNSPGITLTRAPEPLSEGDLLPDYHFTNELGQAMSLAQFRGQPFAFTFIFTRCPLPNFCPRMSSNFEEVQKKLETATNAPAKWHLFTISFDPEFDTPTILKAYSERFGADPKHWSFLTGSLAEITTISEQVGQTFWREQGAINHNLRTVVVNSQGKIRRIITGNNWTPDEVVDEIIKAK